MMMRIYWTASGNWRWEITSQTPVGYSCRLWMCNRRWQCQAMTRETVEVSEDAVSVINPTTVRRTTMSNLQYTSELPRKSPGIPGLTKAWRRWNGWLLDVRPFVIREYFIVPEGSNHIWLLSRWFWELEGVNWSFWKSGSSYSLYTTQ